MEAIIFDCGGVLLDHVPEKRLASIAATYQIDPQKAESVMLKYLPDLQTAAISEKEFWVKFSEELGKPLPANYENLWDGEFVEHASIKEDVWNLVPILRANGYKVAMLSNTEVSHARHLRKLFPESSFDAYTLSNEVRLRKPNPEIYTLTMQKLGVDPEKTIFVDDFPELVSAARNLGMKGIHFTDYVNLVRDLKKEGVKLR